MDGGRHDIKGSESKGTLGDVSEDLWGEIVKCGFEDSDGGVSGVDGFTDAETEDVGKVFRVAGACAVADVLYSHGWLRAEGGGESADEGRAGGGDEFFFDVRGVGRKAAE